ncbi:CRISPR-associated endonuclease/helicase Cas3 [Haloferula luteola]|uniref:CRISPR-associated endonuclease/helicase Cas3 n=1 Tax=Haloferula luteola TaxID=595692 RepID=A0A840V6N4_9BACT|nr:CRISPR-associated helicase Cas3' [Haloferula luteola]MBB5353685.1 CRISPR-associated endonuclease/helicase Cas3 [Haloferula luteola]
MNQSGDCYIAHVRKTDGATQTVEIHLTETAELCSLFASVIGLQLCGRLLGLLHDLGKYSSAFQQYIRDVTGLNGEEAKSTAEKRRDKVDHATSGAQYVWGAHKAGNVPCFMAQVLANVIMSHHSRSGMKDFIDLTGKSPFLIRLGSHKTHKQEVLDKANPAIRSEIDRLLASPSLVAEFKSAITAINGSTSECVPRQNAFSLLTRYLFSCLLDADRLSTADFENPRSAEFRTTGHSPDWNTLLNRFESHIAAFESAPEINQIRALISNECRAASTRPDRLFTLQVPTGGGKTLASLRFALHRAASPETHRVDRIIYILPYTSILDQNAKIARNILGDEAVLEHHSNLSDEKDTWRNRVLSENWDTPVVFTTSVQFLNSLFAAGTKTARRMHQLSNAILIFDEIQSLPVKTVHLFNNAIHFLTQQGHTTVVLCTATMPLLQSVDSKLGALPLTQENEIIGNKTSLFDKLKRTTIIDDCRPEEWSNQEVAAYARDLQNRHHSLLIVCNTKNSALQLFDLLKSNPDAPVIHLSTNMCPAHRRHRISQIHAKLDPKHPQPVFCISTQLIEAGVDLDFGCVIRSLAGLDSIVQAAGRCNRHGNREMGFVHVLNFKEEKLGSSLKDIELAQQITLRILHEYTDNPARFDHDLLSARAMERYYGYYFYQRADEMSYPCEAGKGKPPLAKSCNLLDLLSLNQSSLNEANRTSNAAASSLLFKHSYSTAAQAFQVIDAPTQGIIVPYNADGHCGSDLIGKLAASYTNEQVTLADQVRLHKQAQQYTVNAFPKVIEKLAAEGALREVQPGEGIYYLDERYYHADLGVTLEALSEQHLLNI